MAHVVHHATSIPVSVEGTSVTFGRHKDVSVEAWGGGKKYNKRNKQITYHNLVLGSCDYSRQVRIGAV